MRSASDERRDLRSSLGTENRYDFPTYPQLTGSLCTELRRSVRLPLFGQGPSVLLFLHVVRVNRTAAGGNNGYEEIDERVAITGPSLRWQRPQQDDITLIVIDVV